MIDYNLWKENIQNNLLEVSDTDFQYDVWVKGSRPNYISSFAEVYCQLYDNNMFEEFIKESKDILDAILLRKLSNLNEQLQKYDEGKKTDAQIINDPKWQEIVRIAKDAVEYWKKVGW